mmetsp:Transcript_61707/g.145117  ORF Transcript_61707/g.145117 Transcript_61707/m.145117 type:complete len:249 (+) Transcript_61707:182-928(+)
MLRMLLSVRPTLSPAPNQTASLVLQAARQRLVKIMGFTRASALRALPSNTSRRLWIKKFSVMIPRSATALSTCRRGTAGSWWPTTAWRGRRQRMSACAGEETSRRSPASRRGLLLGCCMMRSGMSREIFCGWARRMCSKGTTTIGSGRTRMRWTLAGHSGNREGQIRRRHRELWTVVDSAKHQMQQRSGTLSVTQVRWGMSARRRHCAMRDGGGIQLLQPASCALEAAHQLPEPTLMFFLANARKALR